MNFGNGCFLETDILKKKTRNRKEELLSWEHRVYSVGCVSRYKPHDFKKVICGL